MTTLVYKIAPASLWQEMQATGDFPGAPVDHADGYVHLSAADQVRETARLYFSGLDDLVLIAVASSACGDALKWEQSRGGALFPHLYGTLALAMVAWTAPLVRNEDGLHVFPDLETGR